MAIDVVEYTFCKHGPDHSVYLREDENGCFQRHACQYGHRVNEVSIPPHRKHHNYFVDGSHPETGKVMPGIDVFRGQLYRTEQLNRIL